MSKNSKRAASANRLSNLSLTVYPSYALIQGSYPVNLDEGANAFQIEGLPSEGNYQPLSLYFDSFEGPGQVTLGTVNYRRANLTPQALLDAAVGKKVTVRYGGTTESEQHEISGTLLSGTQDTALLKLKGGSVREVRDVVGYEYTAVPDGLSNTPSLSVNVEATKKGGYQVTLMYKALSFRWNADYKWLYDEERGVISIDGNVYITNNSGASFQNAAIKVVAGDAGSEDDAPSMQPRAAMALSAPMGGAGLESVSSKNVRNADSEGLGQVKVFTIPGRGNIEQGDAQKIPFFSAAEVPVTRENRVRTYRNWHARNAGKVDFDVNTIFVLNNDTDKKLGQPLPGGHVSVMQRDSSGTLLKSGGATMGDLAVGEETKLQTGSDFDLKASRVVLDVDRASEPMDPDPREVQQAKRNGTEPRARQKVTLTKSCAVELFNGKNTPVDFIVEEATAEDCNFAGDNGFTQVSAGQHEQRVTVGAGEKATLKYTLVQTLVEYVQ